MPGAYNPQPNRALAPKGCPEVRSRALEVHLRGRALPSLLAAVAAIGLFTWSARAGDGTTVEERLARVEQRLTEIEARLKTLPATGGTSPAPPSDASAAPPGADEKKDVIVYATASGTKYHRAGCSYLRSSSIPMKLSEARAKGLTPCSRCGPP